MTVSTDTGGWILAQEIIWRHIKGDIYDSFQPKFQKVTKPYHIFREKWRRKGKVAPGP